MYEGVRSWPFSDPPGALFSVRFGENRLSDSLNQRQLTTPLTNAFVKI
jgi:hypothetical protein